jgi:protein-disulfide isomerase
MADLTSAALPPAGSGDHLRGPTDAAMVVFYGDFTCVRCAVDAQRLAAAPVRVAYRHLVLSARGPRGAALARAAEAAGLQGAFWPFHDRLFADQGHQDDPHLWALCEELGLDLERFDRDRRSDAITDLVAGQTREALRGGAAGTPTVVLADGSVHAGSADAALAGTGVDARPG